MQFGPTYLTFLINDLALKGKIGDIAVWNSEWFSFISNHLNQESRHQNIKVLQISQKYFQIFFPILLQTESWNEVDLHGHLVPFYACLPHSHSHFAKSMSQKLTRVICKIKIDWFRDFFCNSFMRIWKEFWFWI